MKYALQKLENIMESENTHRVFSVLIVLNAILLGIETVPIVSRQYGDILTRIDQSIAIIFVIEVSLRLIGGGRKFFSNGWNVFDFFVVFGGIFTFSSTFAAFRTLRILRLTEILSLSKHVRIITKSLISIVPGALHMLAIIALIFYIFALVGHDIFSVDHKELFGGLDKSMMTLLLILLGDGIGDAINATMNTHPYSYVFFILYAAVMSFTLLNLLFGIIIDAVQTATEKEMSTSDNNESSNDGPHSAEYCEILRQLNEIRKKVERISNN